MDPSVLEGIQQYDQTTRTFGKNAAKIANAYKVSGMPPRRSKLGWTKKPKSAPRWDQVYESKPFGPETPLENLRQELNINRYLRFEKSDKSLSLAIRAHPNGEIEAQLMDAAGTLLGATH